MKPLNKLLLLIFIAAAMYGCNIYDDTIDCVRDNTTLIFKYTDGSGNDAFLRDIQSVDAFIFDANKKLVAHKRFESGALSEFAGWRNISLSPGDYYAVCWGNVGNNSRLSEYVPGVTTFDSKFIQIPANITTGGNQIYYAPFKTHPQAYSGAMQSAPDPQMTSYAFTVRSGRDNVKEMLFVRAHRTINVYIMGYSSALPATVTGTQLCAEYDFYYNSRNVFRNFTQTALPATTPEGAALLATFHVGFSEIYDDMNFTLRRGPTGEVMETVNLKQFLAAFPAAYGSTIDILIRFGDLGVTITVPSWVSKPITPGR